MQMDLLNNLNRNKKRPNAIHISVSRVYSEKNKAKLRIYYEKTLK